ncbi:hypothetical protein [Desulfosarcina ovata]|nr:hypothetical protein [Desulfosarcina ovata]
MNFQITCKRENGNLHVAPVGDFDGSSAWELIHLLDQQYDGQGQVHIDTGRLRNLCPFGCNTFQCKFYLSRVPAHRLLFKGENGHALAPEGSLVVAARQRHPCQCNGDCAQCRCNARVIPEKQNPQKVLDNNPPSCELLERID